MLSSPTNSVIGASFFSNSDYFSLLPIMNHGFGIRKKNPSLAFGKQLVRKRRRFEITPRVEGS